MSEMPTFHVDEVFGPDYVLVPCPIHKRHDLTPIQAARVIVTLNGQAEDLANNPDWGYDLERDQCADNLLRLSHDQEGYGEYVADLMELIGIETGDDGELIDHAAPSTEDR